MRPERLVVVTATGTDVGKTWVASRLAEHATRDGLHVAARKPAQSFDPTDNHRTDAEVLALATGDDPHRVCLRHRWYPRALAPPMAAHAIGQPSFTIEDLAGELDWDPATQLGLVEGAGGLHSPLADDGDTLSLIDTVQPDIVVIVADAELGTINSVLLTVGALGRWPFVVHLNRFEPDNELHRLNRDWLARRRGLPVTVSIDDLHSRLFGR